MHIIGIVGGVASGKSLATRYFKDLGAAVLDGDRVGHEVLRRPDVMARATARWGAKILDAEGQIDRAEVARIVFGASPEAARELKFLEDLTHPHIRCMLNGEVRRLAAEGVTKAVVLDAPLLLKAGWDDFCDILVYVDAPEPFRRARAASRGWTAEHFANREAAQVPLDAKRARADVILDNSGAPEQLREQIQKFWDSLLG